MTKAMKLKDGDSCEVIAGADKGKSGNVTITIVQKYGVRFMRLAKNVRV